MTHAGPGTADPMFAVLGACANATEREMAQRFIAHAPLQEGRASDVFADRAICETALASLSPHPRRWEIMARQ